MCSIYIYDLLRVPIRKDELLYDYIKQKINSLNEQQLEKETYRELAATYIIRYLQAFNNLVLNYPSGSYKTGLTQEYQEAITSIQKEAEEIGSGNTIFKLLFLNSKFEYKLSNISSNDSIYNYNNIYLDQFVNL